MEALSQLLDGFANAATPINLLFALLGVLLGTAASKAEGDREADSGRLWAEINLKTLVDSWRAVSAAHQLGCCMQVLPCSSFIFFCSGCL